MITGEIVGTRLGKSYRRAGGKTVQALADCSFRFEAGRLNVVMGTSGCGKSTLAHMLAGYLPPDSGTLTIDGVPITTAGPDRLLVFQETALLPWMTVEDNVLFGPVSRGMPKLAAQASAIELLERFGLGGFKDMYPNQLSGGMMRRAELAQALINQPKVMILDEPFRGLDVLTRELMQEHYLKLYDDTRLTTVFITSELDEALILADRIFIMSDAPGRIETVIDVDLPRPRDHDLKTTRRFAELEQQALSHLHAGRQW